MAYARGSALAGAVDPLPGHISRVLDGWKSAHTVGLGKQGVPLNQPHFLSCVWQVLFTPATQAARQAACTIVEALATVPSRKQQVLDLLTRYHVGAGGDSG